MKKIFASIIIIAASAICSMNAFAARQEMSSIKGSVISTSDNSPVGFATVAVMQMDSTIVTGIACDENGYYTINNLQKGDYILSASMIGYKTSYVNVTLRSAEEQIDPIYISEDSQMLQSAVVTEKVKLVEMKLDKVVMNVSQSAYAHGSNALDLMKKAPGVTIDKDGNVKLNGKSVQVWIDGRPSYLDGKSLEALLRSTNGESIDKFELMANPSAKYDAEGQGGIINIKTKKNLASGFNGSMGLGAGGFYFKDTNRAPWQESYWLNLGLRTKKTNTRFSIYEGFYNTDLKMDNNLTLGPEGSVLRQEASSLLKNMYHNYNVKLTHDWFINDKNTVGAIFYAPGEYSCMTTDNSVTKQWYNDVLTQNTDTEIDDKSWSNQYNVNLNYTHVFDESRSAELTTNLDYYRNGARSLNFQDDITVLANDPDNKVITHQDINTNQIYDIYSAKVDYQTVVKQRFMLETGAKWAMSVTDNNGVETVTGMPNVNSDFLYRENIAAAYVSMAGQFSEKFSAKFGLRGEFTHSYGDWKSAGEVTKRHYFDLFPTAFLGYNPNENWRLGLSYTRRLKRPNYNQLDPTKTYVDASTYLIGNPDLLPSYSNDISLNVGFGQYLSFATGYQHESNILVQVPSFDNEGNELMYWNNYGKEHIVFTGFNVSALPITKWWDWTFSVTGMYLNAVLDDIEESNSKLGAQLYTDFTFNLPKDWKISCDAQYQSPMAYGLYKMRQTFTSNFSVKKNLLDNRMTLTFRVDDIFNSRNNNMDVLTPVSNSKLYIGQKYYSRKAIFDITWNFGKAQQTKTRKVGNLDEISRVGGNGNN